MSYSFRLAARVLLYASSHRQDNTYNGVCYTSCGALAGTRNSSISCHHGQYRMFYMHHPTHRIVPTTACYTRCRALAETRNSSMGLPRGVDETSHTQNSTYHSLCYTRCRALAETRNSSMGLPRGVDETSHTQNSTYHSLCYT